MALSLTCNSTEYKNYLYVPLNGGASQYSIQKTDQQGNATLLDFALVPYNSSFKKLGRGSYIVVDSTTYPKWFTGYITNEPSLDFLGKDSTGKAVWGYVYQATSDDYILSLNPIGLVRPFMNVTMGDILKQLADLLLPGVFDVTNVSGGPLVAQFTPDPQSKFSDVVKTFCDAADFAFYANDKKLYFLPQDTLSGLGSFTLDGNDTNFTPGQTGNSSSGLTITAITDPIVNDVVALGDIEPQAYMQELFIGTGLDASFDLMASVFGADTSVILTDSFTSAQIDSATWDVYDSGGTHLTVFNGYLNIIGGTGTLEDVRVQSKNPIPLEANIRFTHGEWDFVSGTGEGIIGSVWTQEPSNTISAGCLYGLHYIDGVLKVIINGADTTDTFTVDTTKRYILRTIAEFGRHHRTPQSYSYLDKEGTRQVLTCPTFSDVVSFATTITEVDPSTGKVTKSVSFTSSDVALNGSTDTYGKYALLMSKSMHATVSGVTVSVPLNATLEILDTTRFVNLSFDEWSDSTHPVGWSNPNNVFEETTFSDSGYALKLIADASGNASVEQSGALAIQAGTKYTISARLQKALTGTTTGTLTIALVGGGDLTGVTVTPGTDSGLPDTGTWTTTGGGGSGASGTFKASGGNLVSVTIVDGGSGYTSSPTFVPNSGSLGTSTVVFTYSPVVTDPGLIALVSTGITTSYTTVTATLTAGIATIPRNLKLVISLTGGDPSTCSVWVDGLRITSDFVRQFVGPNELDAMDGKAPIATIVATYLGAPTNSSFFVGTPQYNPGQDKLVFFKDSITQTGGVVLKNQVVKLSYRAAGPSLGRALDLDSINGEAARWGDNGHRTLVKKDFSPAPRNSAECELAAAAYVGENDSQHYEGSYTQWSDYFSAEPKSGGVIKFLNILDAVGLQAEQITEVISTCASEHPVEHFQHVISFGKSNSRVQKLLARFQTPQGIFQKNAYTFSNPIGIDVQGIGLAYAPDVTKPILLNYDNNFLYIDAGQNLASGAIGFEVRYTDEGWGVHDGKNLVLRTSSRTFTVPRTEQGKLFFIRQAMPGNLLQYSEDQSQSSYSGIVFTSPILTNPSGKLSHVSVCSSVGDGNVLSTTFSPGSSSEHAFSFSMKAADTDLVVTASLGTGGQGTLLYGDITPTQTSITVTADFATPLTTPFVIYVGDEQMQVTAKSGPGNTQWGVTRGYGSTTATSHANSASVSTDQNTKAFALSQSWQRYTLPIYGVLTGTQTLNLTFKVPGGSGVEVQTTWWSVQSGTLAETAYYATNATVYGAVSRFSAGMHVSFPLPATDNNGNPLVTEPQATFIFGRDGAGGPADVAVNQTTNTPIARTGGVLIEWDAIAETGPVGADLIIDIQLNGVSIFGTTKLVIPAGTADNTRVSGTGFLGSVIISPGDRLQGIVKQVGSTTPGQSVTVQLYWE